MSNSWTPFYTGDYERDTKELTLQQHGAYLKLLMHCWSRGERLPMTDAAIFRIASAFTPEEQNDVRFIINKYFVKTSTGYLNKKAEEIKERQEKIRDRNIENGKKGGRPKEPKTNPEKTQGLTQNITQKKGNPEPDPKPDPNNSPSGNCVEAVSPKQPKAETTKRGTRLPADWMPSTDLIEWSKKESPSLEADHAFVRELERFRDYWNALSGAKAVKTDWNATWRNWVRNVRPSAGMSSFKPQGTQISGSQIVSSEQRKGGSGTQL